MVDLTPEDFDTRRSDGAYTWRAFIEALKPNVPMLVPPRGAWSTPSSLRSGIYTTATRMGMAGELHTTVVTVEREDQVWVLWTPEE